MKIAQYLRWIILGAILGATMVGNYLHINYGAVYPSVHAVCPLGGLENLWAWAGGRANLQKLFSGTMTLFFFTLIFAFIFGRSFCGQICPFGALQELAGKIGKRKPGVPEKADKIMRRFKYVVLIFITIAAWFTSSLWISPYDPWAAFAHIWSGSMLISEMRAGAVILALVLAASIFVDRFFCKYLCPAGAMYGIISRLSPCKIKREDCSSCGLCAKACPMRVEVDRVRTVKSSECIACGQCVVACQSKKREIQMTVFNRKIKPVAFTLSVTIFFFGALFALDAAGMYQVSIPAVADVRDSGAYINIADLRGSMDIETGASYVGMQLSDFYALMEIPKDVPKETRLKDVVSYVPGYDFHAMKATKTK